MCGTSIVATEPASRWQTLAVLEAWGERRAESLGGGWWDRVAVPTAAAHRDIARSFQLQARCLREGRLVVERRPPEAPAKTHRRARWPVPRCGGAVGVL